MIDFTLHTQIDRPAGEVFDYVTDPERLPTWQTNTISSRPVTGEPLGVGTRLREVHLTGLLDPPRAAAPA